MALTLLGKRGMRMVSVTMPCPLIVLSLSSIEDISIYLPIRWGA